MAGAGYKLFNTGDVLTAAQVNTYLMEQTVMRFATTTARDTGLSGVLAEGMICYIDADNNLYKYTGSAWVNIDSGSTSPLTTKGDLYTYSTTDARLAVGNNGETLVADSSTTTGLRWQGNFAAGKNAIINGDFRIWQRGTTFTSPANTAYTADRWKLGFDGNGTCTVSRQAFTAGTAPVAGYEGEFFLRHLITSAGTTTFTQIFQPIEDVRTFAGQTVTFSFWAKAETTRSVFIYAEQFFGSGGSSTVQYLSMGNANLTTSWQRFSFTVALSGISGKTIGTGSSLNFYIRNGTTLNAQLDVWGVQVEAGSVATPFTTATGTLAGELAACQRYYHKSFRSATAPANNASSVEGAVAVARQQTSGNIEPQIYIIWKVQMRTAPSVTLFNVYSGTTGQWSDGTTVSANARAFNLSDTAGNIDNTDVALNYANAVIHYTADAEL